jgi:hypothetical protein
MAVKIWSIVWVTVLSNLYVVSSVSEKHIASIYPEDGGSRFIQTLENGHKIMHTIPQKTTVQSERLFSRLSEFTHF